MFSAAWGKNLKSLRVAILTLEGPVAQSGFLGNALKRWSGGLPRQAAALSRWVKPVEACFSDASGSGRGFKSLRARHKFISFENYVNTQF